LLSPLAMTSIHWHSRLRITTRISSIRGLFIEIISWRGSPAAKWGARGKRCAIFMYLDFEIQRSTRRCAVTDRALEPGDECYSVLEAKGSDVVRKDFCGEAWSGPPEGVIGWWKARIPEVTAKKVKLAPNDVLLQLFDRLVDPPGQEDMRYVLALLLIRRRVLRVETPLDFSTPAAEQSNADSETLVLYCPKRDVSYTVPVQMPTGERVDEIQQRLSEWLIAEAA